MIISITTALLKIHYVFDVQWNKIIWQRESSEESFAFEAFLNNIFIN